MKFSNAMQSRVSKIVKKQRFVKDIFTSIVDKGGKVLLVGGAVRDLVLEKEIKDLDFEVYGVCLEQLEQILQKYGPVSLIGKSFGVLRLHGIDVDWSLPRKDSSGRHPIVAYDPYMSFEQAFIRRDLTMNAMGIDMQTFELIDIYQGLKDLEHKIVRSPDLDFFVQDPLRLLRVMQFVGRFEMSVDHKLSEVCMSIDLTDVSLERIEQEFSKLLLQSDRPSLGLQWLVTIKRFHDFFPELLRLDEMFLALDLAAGQSYQSDQEKLPIMWAIIVSYLPLQDMQHPVKFSKITADNKQQIVNFMKKFTRHQKMIDVVALCVWYESMLHGPFTDVQLLWLAYWLSPDCSLRLFLQFFGLKKGQQEANSLCQRAKKLGILDAPRAPLLTGKDFLDVAKGCKLGMLVKKAYCIQLDQAIDDRSVLKSLVLDQQLLQ